MSVGTVLGPINSILGPISSIVGPISSFLGPIARVISLGIIFVVILLLRILEFIIR